MKKALKKFILITLIILIALTFASVSNYAATGSFSVSTSSVTLNKGETTSFTITATNCGGQFTITSSNSNVASVSKSEVWAENGVNEGGAITITANSAGTATITITANNVSTTNPPSEVTGSKTINVTVTEPAPEPEPTPEPTPDPEPEQPSTGSENQGGEQQTGETYTFSTITIDGTKYENGDTLTVENDKSSVRVQADIPSNYSISVNGNSVSGFNVNLGEGTNTIKVTDLSSGKTITVNVTRMPLVEENTPPNVMDNTEVSENTVDEETAEDSGLKLEKLTIEGLELIPEFDPDIYSYTVNINMDEQDYSSLNIDAVANDYMASVGIDGNQNLQEGENIINIILTSADGEEIVTYQLIVNKITSASEVVGETTNEDNNQKMPIIIAIVAIIVIVIIVAIIVLIRKYKKMNPDYDDYDGYGLYDYDLYNKQDDNSDNNQNYEDDNPYKFNNSDEETQDSEEYDYDDPIQDEGKKKKKRGKGKHA